ncbi:MAG TPA: S8 family serine peptidase, partial [Acidimicrobiia bacterium]|nr:S8 family serine peptidase [Acidimicrobiia bacterium]
STDACGSSPARVAEAITVGASTITDTAASFSNFGSCVDLFAPGASITSAWRTSNSATAVLSGTSMASPAVAGVAARYLEANPCAAPAQVAAAITTNATPNVPTGVNAVPPRLLFAGPSYIGAPQTLAPCPFTLHATTGVKGRVPLSWIVTNGGSLVSQLQVFRGTSANDPSPVLVATPGVDSTTYVDVPPVFGPTYWYTVRATNAVGTTTSSVASATPLSPGPPAASVLSATASNAKVHLSWTTPDDGGASLQKYRVMRGTTSGSEALLTEISVPGPTTFDDTPGTGLANGQTSFYKIEAVNGVGTTASNEVSATPYTSDGAYFSLSPARILDSRNGTGLSGPWQPSSGRDLTVLGRGGVPSAGVTAVVLNVTAVDATAAGHAIVHPSGTAAPVASNLNFTPGTAVPNLVVVAPGTGGAVRIENNSPGTTQYIADVAGFFADGSNVNSGSRYKALAPARALDTRPGTATADGQFAGGGAAAPNQTKTVTIAGRAALGVPAGAVAVALNVTAVQPTAAGHLRVWPNGLAVPNVSNVNFVPGQIVPNLVVVGIGAGGAVNILNSTTGSTDLVADVVGYFGPPPGITTSFQSVTPTRIVDSRINQGTTGKWGANEIRSITIAGSGPVPPTGVTAVVVNVTVVGPGAAGDATLFPSDVAPPNASNLNFAPGQTVPNLVKVKLGPDGKVKLRNSSLGASDYVVDVVGYYH